MSVSTLLPDFTKPTDSVCSIGGQETAAALVDLVIYELSRNPDKQRKLRQELSAIGSKEPTFDDYNTATKYPYLDAVVRET
jgi:cytochrome P450